MALNAWKKLLPKSDKSDPVFFCHIIPIDEEINPINPAKNAKKVRPSIKSDVIIINVPKNPKQMPINWILDRVSFKKIFARIDVKIGCNETIRAIRLADIPFDKA